MASFWGLFLLAGYGLLGGFIHVLNGWLAYWDVNTTKWTTIPILGDFGIGATIALGLQLLVGFLIYRFVNRPRVADMLIETENELRKVVWPSWADTWAGTMAVVVTVAVLLIYLAAADWLYIQLFSGLLG
ncbi:MAG: preprotein translocase subunit SecE [Planctomycetota bacterium]|jgi:preprotein translocase SecE subunit